MTYQEILNNAKGNMGPCKVCPVCDGRACKNTVPGPGAKGVGDTAIRNYQKWQEIRVNMDTICENRPIDTSFDLFGESYKYPIFAGPVGAMKMHYGDKYDDLEYNEILVQACADAGIAAFTGDGLNEQVVKAAARAIGTPIQQGYMKGYYDKIIQFMRNLFSGGFKDNPHLSFGFLTGILRVAKESIFSGMNNLSIHSVLDNKYSAYFGFTGDEVMEMARYYGASDKYEELCQWYDGYRYRY